jgi:signal peptidase I
MTENDNFKGINFWEDDKTLLRKDTNMAENDHFKEINPWDDGKTLLSKDTNMTESNNSEESSFWEEDKTLLRKDTNMTESNNSEGSSFWDDDKTPPLKKGKKKEKQGGIIVFIKDVLSVILMAAFISVVIKTFIVDTRAIPTPSMVPTIEISDRVILSKLSYVGSKTPKRGDIIVLMPPAEVVEAGTDSDLLKRVIGLPGETVEVKDNYVYIDGKPLTEDYLEAQPVYTIDPVVVPEGCYFLLGDNRNNSYDSHLWHNQFVPMSDIKGKAVYRFWPLDRFGNIYHADKVGAWVRWICVHLAGLMHGNGKWWLIGGAVFVVVLLVFPRKRREK